MDIRIDDNFDHDHDKLDALLSDLTEEQYKEFVNRYSPAAQGKDTMTRLELELLFDRLLNLIEYHVRRVGPDAIPQEMFRSELIRCIFMPLDLGPFGLLLDLDHEMDVKQTILRCTLLEVMKMQAEADGEDPKNVVARFLEELSRGA